MKCPSCGAVLEVTVLPTETASTRVRFTLELTHPHAEPQKPCPDFVGAIAGAVTTALNAT